MLYFYLKVRQNRIGVGLGWGGENKKPLKQNKTKKKDELKSAALQPCCWVFFWAAKNDSASQPIHTLERDGSHAVLKAV